MLRVYAKINVVLQILFIFLSVASLSSCNTYHFLPSSSTVNTGIVTNDPDSVPNINWQTEDQRHILLRQNDAIVQQQTSDQEQNTPEQPATLPPAPAVKVTVSLLLPLTGKKAELGQSMLKAAQMAIFDVGSANFELIPRDTKSTKEGALAAATDAINNHTSLILGPVFAEDLKAVKSLASNAHVPVISFTTDWSLADSNTYIMGFLPFTQITRVTNYAQSKGYTKLAVYAPQTEYCDVVIRTLQKNDVPTVHINRYSPLQTDLAALVEDFAATSKNPNDSDRFDFDSLLLPLGSEGLRALVNTLELNGIDQSKVKFLGTGLWDDAVLTNTPSLFGGWFAAPDPALRSDFEKRFRDNYGTMPARLSSLTYDATALAAVLARSTAGATPYSQENLTNPRGFAGIDGIFRFRDDGLSERGLAILEIQSGKSIAIDPAPTAFIVSGT